MGMVFRELLKHVVKELCTAVIIHYLDELKWTNEF